MVSRLVRTRGIGASPNGKGGGGNHVWKEEDKDNGRNESSVPDMRFRLPR